MTESVPLVHRRLRLARVFAVLVWTGAAAACVAAVPGPLAPEALAAIWDAEHVSPPVSPLLRHAEVERRLGEVRDAAPDLFSLEEAGRSVEGRSINHFWFGRGDFHVLLWSQMHGDEPTATSALFDLYEYVRRHRGEAPVARILDRLTVHTVPMLNPDGAERFQRRNAQGIDINRDALRLQTPEGRALKALRDRLSPRLGFNLHNQSWRTSVGRDPEPASISLLAVAFDEARSDNAGRILAKKMCAVVRGAIEPFAAGRIGRYDDAFEVRAFGDNITLWGTPVVLIETGPWPSAEPDPPLVRINFVAIVSALDALATGRAHRADVRRYESLPMNEARLFHTLIRGASVVTGTGAAFTGDVGIVATRAVRSVDGTPRVQIDLRIEDLGDLRVGGALETIDGTGRLLAPLFRDDLAVGEVVDLPEWTERPDGAPVIRVGEPAKVVLLAERGGRYRVERVFRGRN
jgi:hypothetical protein